MADRPYNDADLDAAVAAITEPGRLRAAEELVAQAAPSLQRLLDNAVHEGGWFDDAHRQAVIEAAGSEDASGRVNAVQRLIAEEMRLGMLVGVAVGFELARELSSPRSAGSSSGKPTTQED